MCVCVCVPAPAHVYVCSRVWARVGAHPNLLAWEGCDTKSIFLQILISLNPEFFFALTGYRIKANAPCPPYFLLTHNWSRTNGFTSFSKVLWWSKTHTASSKIWNRITDSISKDDNSYAKLGSYMWLCVRIYGCVF